MSGIDAQTLNQSLRRLHRSAITSLAVCALGITGLSFAVAGPSGLSLEDGVEPSYSLVALALAGLAILLRRSASVPRRSLRAFVYGTALSLLGAVGLGLLGLFVAVRESQFTVGLLYTLAGALLALRPPPTIQLSSPGGAES